MAKKEVAYYIREVPQTIHLHRASVVCPVAHVGLALGVMVSFLLHEFVRLYEQSDR